MKLQDLQRHWDEFGSQDPLWAILTDPNKKGGRWTPAEFFASGVREINESMAAISAAGLTVPRRRALDFGCGVGRLSQALAQYFDQVDGVDIAPSMVNDARKFNQFGDRCRYTVNSVNDLTLFADHTFDLVYSSITLQHMHPRYAQAYVAEFIHVVAPEGLVVFQLPCKYRGKSLRKMLIDRLPYAVKSWAGNLRLRLWQQPLMNMIATPEEEVLHWVQASGGSVVHVVSNESANSGWESRQYWVKQN